MATEAAVVNSGSRISAVWAIPILAVVLGAWVVVHNLMTEGPEITISFTTAEGLEAGKTTVKHRNVNVGVVETVKLSEDFKHIVATVKLDRQAEPMLREDTRFWVVTARVGAGNISGLETLLSGAYIQLAPGTGAEGRRSFEALEEPPLTPIDADGLRLKLTSDRASSVSNGDPVLYNGFKVGRVESMKFDPQRRLVHYVIFIDAPYHDLVNSAVRFWDVSGVSLSAGADGFKVETSALESILLGGIAFGVPEGVSAGDPVEHNTEFKLYRSYEAILQNPFRYGAYYVVVFSQSVKGLLPGAPVEFRGIQIGRVERLMLKESLGVALEEHQEGEGLSIPVLLYIEPARMELPDRASSLDTLQQSITIGVGNGMRASMDTGNLLTGAKYVNIDYYPDAEPAELGTFLEWTTIPVIDTGLGHIQQQISSILAMVNRLPLEQTVADANSAIESLDATLDSLNSLLQEDSTRAVPTELNRTLEELRGTLQGFSPGSAGFSSLNSSLLRLNRILGNLDQLTRKLAAEPNSVLLPSSPDADPLPEVEQ